MSISASHAGEGEYTNNPDLIRSRFPVSGILFIISGKDCAFANILLTSYNAHLTEYPVWQHLFLPYQTQHKCSRISQYIYFRNTAIHQRHPAADEYIFHE